MRFWDCDFVNKKCDFKTQKAAFQIAVKLVFFSKMHNFKG